MVPQEVMDRQEMLEKGQEVSCIPMYQCTNVHCISPETLSAIKLTMHLFFSLINQLGVRYSRVAE
jgi:hypothetical protein